MGQSDIKENQTFDMLLLTLLICNVHVIIDSNKHVYTTSTVYMENRVSLKVIINS